MTTPNNEALLDNYETLPFTDLDPHRVMDCAEYMRNESLLSSLTAWISDARINLRATNDKDKKQKLIRSIEKNETSRIVAASRLAILEDRVDITGPEYNAVGLLINEQLNNNTNENFKANTRMLEATRQDYLGTLKQSAAAYIKSQSQPKP